MDTRTKALLDLTASDLMSPSPLQIPEHMPLRDAADLLVRNQVSGAPVVNGQGQCTGVLSADDFLRLAAEPPEEAALASSPQVVTCSFQRRHRSRGGQEVTLCILPAGVCPIQVTQKEKSGEELLCCSQPHTVLVDWQTVEVEKLPSNEVGRLMTPDPLTVGPTARISELARTLVASPVHHLVVVDEEQRPIGIVSSTDILGALARAGVREQDQRSM